MEVEVEWHCGGGKKIVVMKRIYYCKYVKKTA
jgi:hypothetical protein